jgi:transposase
MARKTKLNADVQERICDALREGNTRRVSALLAGISEQTFYNWINWADPESPNHKAVYLEFLESIKKAEAEAENEAIKDIQRAGKMGSWQARAWFLERRNPKDWAKRERVEVKQFNFDISNLSDEELAELEESPDPAAYLAAKNRDREGEA